MEINPYESPKTQTQPDGTEEQGSAFSWAIKGAVWGMTIFAQVAGALNLILPFVFVPHADGHPLSAFLIGLVFYYTCSTFIFSFAGMIAGLFFGLVLSFGFREGAPRLEPLSILVGVVVGCAISYWLMLPPYGTPLLLFTISFLLGPCIGWIAGRKLGRKMNEQIRIEFERVQRFQQLASDTNTDIDLT